MGERPGLDAGAYLERIGHRGAVAPTLATLRALHLAHLRTVPFENLDIHLGRPIRLDEAALFAKIVGRRRGGFCYELNGLFARLLREVGFGVDLLAAQFPRPDGGTAPEFDHLTLLVRVADDAAPWLADVGAGRGSSPLPLRLRAGEPAVAAGEVYRLTREGERWRLWRREAGGDWESGYGFGLAPRALADFEEGCRYHQTSPESHFTQGRICTLATPRGRVTLAERRLIETVDGERTERDLADEAAYRAALREHVGIELEAGAVWCPPAMLQGAEATG